MRRAALLVNPSIDARQIDIAIARPSSALASNPPREVAMIAFGVLARTEPVVAAERLDQHGNRLRADDRSFLLTQVAASGMRKLMPEAHAWTLAARDSAASDETLAWMARAALRAEDWPLVKSVIGRMSPEGRADPAWTYWLGRALQKEAAAPARGAALRRLEFAKADLEGLDASGTATDATSDSNVSEDAATDRSEAGGAGTEVAMPAGRPDAGPPSSRAAPRDPGQPGASPAALSPAAPPPAAPPGIAQPNSAQHQARVLFTSIAGRPHFYGQLAGEELGVLTTAPPRAAPPTEAEMAEARGNASLARAQRFYELGLRVEGNREWSYGLRGLSDRQLLAAAELARQRGLLDRAVNTADRTRQEHNYDLRFVAPFADKLNSSAREQSLDPAWVYGLIRQESRFVMDARSSAGASGLMQLMPATARWVARKMGVRDFSPAQINELDTNLQFGTFYLKSVLDDLEGSPLLASAAYNAGPGRPKSWRNTLSRPVEGAIFAEIIPFNETRGYVKAVLSNATYYAALFSGKPQSLKAMLGTVRPGGGAATGD
jgi:soluble lytic murein transglycosylase-like protein